MALTLGRSTALMGATVLMVFGTTACATKKYVRETVNPVEARVAGVETKSGEHASAIGALENNVSRADEKATEAGRWAKEAGESANRANEAAGRANEAAMTARTRADEAFGRAEAVAGMVDKIDNYQLVTTENVLFPLNRHTLTDEGKAQLDQAVANIKNSGNYVLEVHGFTDPTGSKQTNLALSQRRADSVVRYLTTEHGIPLRKIHVIGVGEETAVADEMRTREARKQARRVEVKVFALDLGGQSAQGSQVSTSQSMPDTGTRARQVQTPTTTQPQQ
jgi:outer membrane protein OmpA-like peptidoglycan-associated protein